MNTQVFLQQLCELPPEEGRATLQHTLNEITDYGATGQLIKDEALRQRDISPFISLKLAELLIFFGETAHHRPSRALGLVARGDALSAIGHEQAAMDSLDAAAAEFLHLGDEVNWARTRVSWIVSCAWLGRITEALQAAEHAREVFLRHNERYWVCVIDHNTAIIHSQIGQYREALALYERIITIYPTLTDQSQTFIQRAIALAKLNQGRNLSWLGDFERAQDLLLQARASFLALEQPELLIRAEVSLADLDYVQGYYGSALRRYYQVHDHVIQNNIHEMTLASMMLCIGNCLVKLNRAQEACQLAAQALQIRRRYGAVLDVGNALREYATALIAAQRRKEALATLDEAWTLFEQAGLSHHATITRVQQAELLLAMGAANDAYDLAHQLLPYVDKQGSVSLFTSVRLIMASALIQHARTAPIALEKAHQSHLLNEAKTLCEQIIALAHQHHLQEQGYKSLYLLGQIANIQGHVPETKQYYAAAIEQIEYILEDLVLDLRPAFLHTTWSVYEDMIALCLQHNQVERAFSYLERARSLALRQFMSRPKDAFEGNQDEEQDEKDMLRAKNAAVLRLQNELKEWQGIYHAYSAQLTQLDTSVSPEVDRSVIEAELQRSEGMVGELFERLHLYQLENTTIRQQRRSTPILEHDEINKGALAHIQEHLLDNQLLLAYFLYKGKLVIFAVTKEQINIHENLDGVAQLEHLLPLFYAHLEPAGWPDPLRPPQQAIRRLLQKLFSVLLAPVAALLPHEQGTITFVPYGLLHRFPFHALYDGKHFLIERFQVNYLPAAHLLVQLATQKQQASTKPPLIFGYSGQGQLQRVLAEARTLQSMLNGVSYLEEEATIEHLIKHAPASPIIHLATHGKCRLDAPNFSYIRLADGQLNAIDAFSLDLQGCQLVTLSGCETGLALIGGGDEQLGLGRAFLAAGASSLVMSLWPVEDEATNELMILFYQHLLHNKTKAEALQAAQQTLLHHPSSRYSHPYFWAAFRLVGERSPLHSHIP